MSGIWIIKVLSASHLIFAALFVGGNVFLDFILTPRLELIPPGQAARLGEKMGNDFALFNWACLVGLMVTGVLMILNRGIERSVFSPSFLTTSYGTALLIMEFIWTTLIITGAAMTFYLRPRVIVKLPYNASREEIETGRDATITYATWMRRLARYNGVSGVIALTVGAFLARGGLW